LTALAFPVILSGIRRPRAAPIIQALPYLVRFPSRHFLVDYDVEANTLYVSLDHPQEAKDSEVTEDGILLRYREDRLVGGAGRTTQAALRHAAGIPPAAVAQNAAPVDGNT